MDCVSLPQKQQPYQATDDYHHDYQNREKRDERRDYHRGEIAFFELERDSQMISRGVSQFFTDYSESQYPIKV